jgi:hypothetical protein
MILKSIGDISNWFTSLLNGSSMFDSIIALFSYAKTPSLFYFGDSKQYELPLLNYLN